MLIETNNAGASTGANAKKISYSKKRKKTKKKRKKTKK